MSLISSDDRFEIVSRLGSGSFGVVYEAFDRYRDRVVALKVLERAIPDAVARFKREFRNLAEVRHLNLASLYELLVLGDKWVLSMERIHGSELLEHLAAAELQNCLFEKREATQPLDADQTLRYRPKKKRAGLTSLYFDHVRDTFRQLATGVAVLHGHGIVHRDIKPSNIMITSEGRVVLLDFGLAVEIARDDSLDRKTVVGTPGYMAPEQIKAAAPNAASDWYSFGVLLYQALTGQLPFTAPTSLEVMEMQVHGKPACVVEMMPSAPEDLGSLADDCIRREPDERPSDSEILQRLGLEDFDLRRVQRRHERRTALIGRGRELKSLYSWISSATPGDPRVVCVDGSPGAGKSALLDPLLDRIRAGTNAFIVGGRCQAWESVPLNAIDVIADSLARELRHSRPPAVDAALSRAVAVTQLFPVLLSARGPAPGEDTIVMPASGQKLIARAASELREILFAAAGDRPLLLFLDDAQWGDFQSAQVLLRLLKPQQRQSVVLLLLYQSEDWRTSLLLQSLNGHGMDMRRLHLKELSRAATAAMLKRATGRHGRRLIDRIFRQTGGNPAMIEMAIESLGRRSADDPALMARAVACRLQHLSSAAHRLFIWLLSTPSPSDELTAASALELFEIDEPLRTLRRQRLIRIRKTGDLRAVDIYHPRMRQALAIA
jgi:serine/threonine protein kinase